MIFRHVLLLFIALGLSATAAAQTVLLIPDSTNDRVAAFSPFDGSIIDLDFIPSDSTNLATPINAIDSGRGTVFLSDQLNDAVFEYDFNGNFVGTIVDSSDGLDNVRGIEVFNNKLYVTVGSNGGGLEDTIQEFDTNGGSQATWATTNVASPFDIFFRANDALIANIDNENIDRYDLSGNYLAAFHDSDGVSGIDFPEQIHGAANGDILVGGFSPPAGVYRYDSSGNEIAYYDVGTGVRGVYELQNGNILWSAGSGVFSLDPATGNSALITDDGSWRFIEAVTVPEPCSAALLAISLLACAAIRRR